MKGFKVTGSFKLDKGIWQKFAVEVAAEDEDGAKEKVLSTLGSRHRVNRNEIEIKDLEEISGDDITDLVVKYQVEER